MLLWIPFYHRPEGVLPLLASMAMIILKHQLSSPVITSALKSITSTIRIILKLEELKPTAHRRLIQELKLCGWLLGLCGGKGKGSYVFRRTEKALGEGEWEG